MAIQPHDKIYFISGTPIPRCSYGTAQKSDSDLILAALSCGYRGLDTACQPKYYSEEIVGQALDKAFTAVEKGGLGLDRSDIFLQTKFTTSAGKISIIHLIYWRIVFRSKWSKACGLV